MNISDLGQYFPLIGVEGSKNMPPQPVNQTAVSIGDPGSPPRSVDMRNVSPKEINELIRAGVDGLLDVMPYTSIDITKINNDADGSYRESLMNQKMDFIGQIEKSIAYEKSTGQSTDFLENVLANLNRINGMEFSPKVDVVA